MSSSTQSMNQSAQDLNETPHASGLSTHHPQSVNDSSAPRTRKRKFEGDPDEAIKMVRRKLETVELQLHDPQLTLAMNSLLESFRKGEIDDDSFLENGLVLLAQDPILKGVIDLRVLGLSGDDDDLAAGPSRVGEE